MVSNIEAHFKEAGVLKKHRPHVSLQLRIFGKWPGRIYDEHDQFAQLLVAGTCDFHGQIGHPGHRSAGVQNVQSVGRVLGQLTRQDQECFGSGMAVN